MTETEQKLQTGDWSPLLRRAVLDEIRRPSRDAVQKLSDSDVARLRELARQPDLAPEVRRDKVLTVLAERAPDDSTAGVLKEVLDAADRPAHLRTLAAIELGQIKGKVAERALLDHVADADPRVAQRAIQSLGMTGDMESFAALKRVPAEDSPALARQLAFSKRLICHRAGKLSDEPVGRFDADWIADDRVRPQALPVRETDRDRLTAIGERLAGRIEGLTLASDQGFTFQMDRSVQHLVFAEGLKLPERLAVAAKQPLIVGIVAHWEERTQQPEIDTVILSQPMDGGLLIQGFRPDGTPVFEGRGEMTKAGVRFAVTNVKRAGQCRFRLHGSFGPDGASVEVEVIARQRPRAPVALNQARALSG